MRTEQERLTALEEITRDYRPVLQNFAYELTMVKGLIVTQTEITQNLGRDMNDVKVRLTHMEGQMTHVEDRITRMDEKLDTILTLLRPS